MKSAGKLIKTPEALHRLMKREFVETEEFRKRWKDLGLDDDDLGALQRDLCGYPEAGDMIQGTGGVRKLRWVVKGSGKGKSGGARVIYIDFAIEERTYLITAYKKSQQVNLTAREKKEIRDFVKSL